MADREERADAGGKSRFEEMSADCGEGLARTERRERPLAAESSSTCSGGGAIRLRPRPSPPSAASAACSPHVRHRSRELSDQTGPDGASGTSLSLEAFLSIAKS